MYNSHTIGSTRIAHWRTSASENSKRRVEAKHERNRVERASILNLLKRKLKWVTIHAWFRAALLLVLITHASSVALKPLKCVIISRWIHSPVLVQNDLESRSGSRPWAYQGQSAGIPGCPWTLGPPDTKRLHSSRFEFCTKNTPLQ